MSVVSSTTGFAGGGGGHACRSKNVASEELVPGSGSPGISISSPALMYVAPCVAPQSDVTKPLKPISSRRIFVSVESFPQAKTPLMRLYEHMIEATPARMAASNGAT